MTDVERWRWLIQLAKDPVAHEEYQQRRRERRLRFLSAVVAAALEAGEDLGGEAAKQAARELFVQEGIPFVPGMESAT